VADCHHPKISMVADLLVDPSKGWLKLQSAGARGAQRLSAAITVANCSLSGGTDVVYLAEFSGSGADAGAANVTVQPDFGTLHSGPKHAQQITVTAELTAKQLNANSSGQLGWLLLHHATVSSSSSTISRRGLQGVVSKNAAGQRPASCWRSSGCCW
jgi:hypothetical protein